VLTSFIFAVPGDHTHIVLRGRNMKMKGHKSTPITMKYTAHSAPAKTCAQRRRRRRRRKTRTRTRNMVRMVSTVVLL
jgi:hypothetical protein